MTPPRLLQLLVLNVILYTDVCQQTVPASQCSTSEWLNSTCKYKCHCENNQCNNTGECQGSSTCERGWFGPACQYMDLVSTNATSPTPDWVYDYPDTQCSPGQEPVTISLQNIFYFTWLRLRLKSPEPSATFGLQFSFSNGSVVKCDHLYTSAVNDTVLDIHCEPGVFFQQLNINWTGVKSLCAVYISGGRNVALGQKSNQTSTFETSYSWKAVDGDANPNYLRYHCSHTAALDSTPKWTLIFQLPHQVSRYNLYNRDSEQQRLQGFVLEAVRENGSVAFNFTDNIHTNTDVYRISSYNPWTPVSSVTIRNTKEYLTLCEVEMFGDVVCPDGQYGRECKNQCNCTILGNRCFVSTGGCPTACAEGYEGKTCREICKETYYGENCTQRCSSNCTNQTCNSTDGRCHSCLGRFGDFCEHVCNATYYGENCTLRCSPNCTNRACNATDGRCDSCLGRFGDFCEHVCNATYYGENCTLRCSPNCTNQACNPTYGRCDSCLGRFGDFCEHACSATYYGENCALRCSSNCTNQTCNATDGRCDSCLGRFGDFCEHVCGNSTFGINCKESCSINCTDHLCDPGTGRCRCIPGSDGEFCDTMLLVQQPPSSPVGVIVGPVIGGVVLIALIAVGVIFFWKRRHQKGETNQSVAGSFHGESEGDSRAVAKSSIVPRESDKVVTVKEKPPVAKKPKHSSDVNGSENQNATGGYYNHLPALTETAIRFNNLESFMTSHGKEFYQEQFKSIPVNSKATTTVALSSENKYKNRYKNIIAYDHSRVHLQTDATKKHGDYINASYIDGYRKKKQFIASQGPTKVMLQDFVHMLWEQGTEVVVMLTNLVEDGKLKCEQYWPDDEQIVIGEITVQLSTTQIYADYTIRRLCLNKKDHPEQKLTHFHFTTWPDKNVPTTAWGLVDLEDRIASVTTSKPIVVHCSAGVGRTGTFIALHNILEEINVTGYMDVFTTVKKLRSDRINMVQTFEQYEFLHTATQIAMMCKGTTVTPGSIGRGVDFLQELSESGQSNMEKEFKSVCLICGEDTCDNEEEELQETNMYYNSRILSNKMKNRFHNVLPKEFYRPVLRCDNNGLTDYINAVFIPSCRKHDHQIVTQLPLPTTVCDFWRLVVQYKVSLIVAFERDLITEDMTIGEYLPESENETKVCSVFNIKSKLLEISDAFELQKIVVTVDETTTTEIKNASSGRDYGLSHLSCKYKDLDSLTLLTLTDKVRSLKPVGEGRVLFTCRNGAELSGLACTMSLLLDRMDNDQHVSVPLVVGTVKAIRPQIIPTLDQYRLLYQALHLFTDSSNEYSNFSTS